MEKKIKVSIAHWLKFNILNILEKKKNDKVKS